MEASNDIMAELNGLSEEHVMIGGAVRLAKRASAKQWRDQVLEYIPMGDHTIETLLELIHVPNDTPLELCARCPCVPRLEYSLLPAP